MLDFNLIDIPQRSQEWKEFRKGKIGASQAAAILGLNPYVTKLQVWEEIAFGKEKVINENMERGIRLEAEALECFNKSKSSHYVPIVVQSKKHPSLIASLDGWWEGQVVELKAPRNFSEEIPEMYLIQMHHQMFVTNTSFCWYMEYVDGMGRVSKIERNESLINRMLKEELAFLQSLIDFKPPEPTDRDWVEENDAGKLMMADRYEELLSMLEELEKEKENLRKCFIETANHPRTVYGNLRFQKIQRKGNIDYQKLIEEYKITDAEKYRKEPMVSWRVDVKPGA